MQDKEKNKKQPGILETVHMVNEKEKKKNEEERLRLEKEEEIEREEYSHKLEEEKIELLKIKQGIIKESDILDLSSDEKNIIIYGRNSKILFITTNGGLEFFHFLF